MSRLNSLICVIGKKALSACEMSAVLKLVFSLLKTELLKVPREIQAETCGGASGDESLVSSGKEKKKVMGMGLVYNMIYSHLL